MGIPSSLIVKMGILAQMEKPPAGCRRAIEALRTVLSEKLTLLTKKGKYGLKAMVHLANGEYGRPVPVLEIAGAQRIPKKFLDSILCELRNAGFVHSKMGKGGGYCLARPAREIMVGDLVRAIDGPLAPVPCASKTRYQRCDDCADEAACAVRQVMRNAQRALSEVLDNCSLERMCELAEPTLCAP